MTPTAVKVPMRAFNHFNLKLADALTAYAMKGQAARNHMLTRDFCLQNNVTPNQMMAFIKRNSFRWSPPDKAA